MVVLTCLQYMKYHFFDKYIVRCKNYTDYVVNQRSQTYMVL